MQKDPVFYLRPMTEKDLPALLELYHQCDDFLALGAGPATPEMVLADLEHSRQAGSLYRGIFSGGGALLGVVDVLLEGFEGDPHTAFLELLMIAYTRRDAGLGKAVVDAVEDEILQRTEVRRIRLAVQTNNPRGRRFWERAGYWAVGEPTRQADGTVTLLMEKKA